MTAGPAGDRCNPEHANREPRRKNAMAPSHAVMRAVGAKRSTVSRLFTFEASLLGFLGGVIGLGIGYALTLIANPIINNQLKTNGIKSTNIITLPIWLILGVIAAFMYRQTPRS